jgi:hypothetical protein
MNFKNSMLGIVCDAFALFYALSIIISMIQYFLFQKVNFISLLFSIFMCLMLSFLLNYGKFYGIDKYFKIFSVCSLFYFIVFCIYLYAYPFFPIFYSVDFVVHLLNSLSLINNVNGGFVLPANPGISLLLAGWLSLGFENVLFFSRFFIAFVVWSSLPFIYFIGNYIFRNYGGIVASLSYILLNPFLYTTLLTSGLYANALGLTLSLATLYWFIVTLENPSYKRVLLAPLFGYTLILAHSSDALVYLTVVSAIIYLIFFEHRYNIINVSLKLLLCFFLGAIIVFAIHSSLFLRLPSALSGPFNQIVFASNEFILYLLREIPLLLNFYLYSNENVFALILFITTFFLAGLYFLKRKLGFGIFPFAWLFLIIVVSFFSTNAWRFALLAFIPFCLLIPLVYEKVLLPLGRRMVYAMSSERFKKIFKILLIIFCFLMLYLSSDSNVIVPIYASSWSRPQQEGFYECLVWFKDYSESDAVVVSVGGGNYMRFLLVVANRTFLDSLPGSVPEAVYDILKNYSNGYVVVWNRLHPYNGSFYYVDLYKNSSLFREVWANEEVTVFKPIK